MFEKFGGSFLPLAGGTLTGSVTVGPAPASTGNILLFASATFPSIHFKNGSTVLNQMVQDAAGSNFYWDLPSITVNWRDQLNGGTTFAQLTSTGLFTVTGGIGYKSGGGGTVTQLTSKSTGVTLNKPSGQVTMNNAALAAGAKVSFVVTNSTVGANDGVLVWIVSGGTANAYRAEVTAIGSGSFTATVENITGGSLSEAPIIGFALMKAAVA